LATLLLLTASAQGQLKKKEKALVKTLPAKYQTWIAEVELMISSEEFEAFMELEKDYQRDAFIRRFWQVRDPYPETARNEIRDRWYEMIAFAQANFDGMNDERSRFLMLNGIPVTRLVVECPTRLQPMEIWFYDGSWKVGFQFFLIFYRSGGLGRFRVWYPEDDLTELFNLITASSSGQVSLEEVRNFCRDGEFIAKAIAWVRGQDNQYAVIVSRLQKPAEPPKGEWIATFAAYSTDVEPGAQTFPAEFQVSYPGRQQNRTVLQGLLRVPVTEIGKAQLGGHESFNFLLNGELLREGELFESFRYKFDFPASEVHEERLPMAFQRTARPGPYTLILRLEDLNSGKFYRQEQTLEIPKIDTALPPPPPEDPESARLLAEANAAISSGENTIKLVQPTGDLKTGMMRVETLTTGGPFSKVAFSLDGQPVLTKRRAPYSVELDLGSLPRPRTLSVVAYDDAGLELASDEAVLNAGDHRFAVRLVEPHKGKTYQHSLQAQVEVIAPEDQAVERVEIYLNETLLATLYQPPYTQPVLLQGSTELAYVRAVAYLTDGNSTEDLVFINAPDYLEEVDVQFVELYTSVLDRQGRPVQGLTQDEFTVLEDGQPQSILRFEQVKDLPFHAGILMDISASMDDSLPAAQQAALRFYQSTLTPKDRAALITFNDRPNLAIKFTNNADTLAGGLAGLKGERGTALYDSVIFALYYFNGIRGQKALLVLSDGKDESSRFTFEDTLEYARRAGITIYTIGLKEVTKDGAARRKLSRLAEDTGGRAFFVEEPAELEAIYQSIQEELRSQFLIAYQSSNTSGDQGFRTIDLKVRRSGVEVKTLSGYYP
jgi:Ca-activated chloride channel family protein